MHERACTIRARIDNRCDNLIENLEKEVDLDCGCEKKGRRESISICQDGMEERSICEQKPKLKRPCRKTDTLRTKWSNLEGKALFRMKLDLSGELKVSVIRLFYEAKP